MEMMRLALIYIGQRILTGQTVSVLRPPLTAPPSTGDINVMIIAAVILIALFLLFVLWKGRRRNG